MRYRLIIPILFLFIAIFSIFAPFSYALDITGLGGIEDKLKDDVTTKDLQEFCERRSGDQMNLETWYSGKCKDADGKLTDSFSGQGVGFSSIILLDLAERVQGKKDPDEGIIKKIQNIIEGFTKIGVSQKKDDVEVQKFVAQQREDLLKSTDSGLLGTASKGLALLINNPPATTRSYVAYISQNLKKHNVISSAYAAQPGYGYEGLAGFLPIWRAVRNVAYIIFVMFFIVYGFMMMFRVNINAKTVISIQLALPKLIFTLLIITFSYAIVGLMVDLMYVFFYVVLSILEAQKIIIIGNLFTRAASGQWGVLLSFLNNTIFAWPASMVGVMNMIIGGPAFISLAVGSILAPIGFIIGIIISIAIFISYIKLLWKLLSAFMTVVISLVTAPIVLLGNALPGSDTFGSWFRGILANLSVFPITMILLLFSYLLMVQPIVNCLGLCPRTNDAGLNGLEMVFGVRNLNNGKAFMYVPFVSPPLGSIGSVAGTDFFNNSPDAMMALLGIALLLMANKYVDIVRDALKVPPFKYGSAISKPLEQGFGSFTDPNSMFRKSQFGARTYGAASTIVDRGTGGRVSMPQVEQAGAGVIKAIKE